MLIRDKTWWIYGKPDILPGEQLKREKIKI
jgi:hypothetical protein